MRRRTTSGKAEATLTVNPAQRGRLRSRIGHTLHTDSYG